MNDYRLNRTSPKIITQKELDEIDKRRLIAIKLNDLSRIEDYNEQVLKIIKDDGLDNEEPKIRLDTAFKTIPYIYPTKKQIEATITAKSIEDVIKETIQEAEIIEIDENKADNTPIDSQ